MKRRYIFVILSIIILLAGIIYFFNNKLSLCTSEAMICPDGTAVGRIGSSCEFENCPVSKICRTDLDCVVFGEDGDCNCGCYNKDALPQDSGGDCFCAAPRNCECIDNKCEVS